MSACGPDPIDTAVDRVAARLIAAPGNDAVLLERIVSTLPERSARWRWLIPQLAALGAIALAAIVWTANNAAPPATVLPSSTFAWFDAFESRVIPSRPGTRVAAQVQSRAAEPLKHSSAPDFDLALPSLGVAAVSPSAMAVSPLLDVAPIEIAEISMTADFPPRQ